MAFWPPTYTIVAPGGTTATWLKAGLANSPSGRNNWISVMSRRLRAAHDGAASSGAEIVHPLTQERGRNPVLFS
jgi:hypothetical protein